uniref:Uncharacterized protein n=1 Tax=Syphacia muris TaxID=451379 RepID=A0A0N5B0U1_9BILA
MKVQKERNTEIIASGSTLSFTIAPGRSLPWVRLLMMVIIVKITATATTSVVAAASSGDSGGGGGGSSSISMPY